MDSQISENSGSNFGNSSRMSESNIRKNKGSDDSDESESSIYKKISKKSHEELRMERINELNMEYEKFSKATDYENAITIMKKLIFFEPLSKLYIRLISNILII
jgi:hypothetical protein